MHECDAQALDDDRVNGQGPRQGTWQEPVGNYADEELFRAEVETLFKRIPLPLAPPLPVLAARRHC